jgi:membrane-bound serine protease (ClpP class)
MARFLSGLIAAVLLTAAPVPAPAQPASDQTTGQKIAVVLDLAGGVGPAAAEYVTSGIADATRRQAAVIVLRLDTPGGLSSSMREIIRGILASPIPVVAYVSPSGARAASAGTYIVYASHVAAMAPSTHLGAATPVQIGGGLFGGGDKKDDEKKDAKAPANAEEAKAVNDAVAYIRSLAQLRGRNAEWAEKAVREAATLTDTEARDQHVIDLIAADLPDLLRQIDGRTVRVDSHDVTLHTRGLAVATVAPNWRAKILAVITDPNIAYLLLLAGLYGLLFEFLSPGGVLPGVIGGICLLVGLYALNLLPISYAGIGLLLLGVAMMVAEAFVPSGALGVGGVAAFVIGSLFLYRGDVPGFQLSWTVVAAATALSAGFLLIALAAIWRAHRRRAVTGDTALLGSTGTVTLWTGESGEVQVMGERWRAVSGASLAPGQPVRVVERRNLTLVVEPAAPPPPQN